MENRKLKRMVVGALLAAVYAVLALVLPMASFGPVQFRFSEALTLLPVFSPVAGIGVTLGCRDMLDDGVKERRHIAAFYGKLCGGCTGFG